MAKDKLTEADLVAVEDKLALKNQLRDAQIAKDAAMVRAQTGAQAPQARPMPPQGAPRPAMPQASPAAMSGIQDQMQTNRNNAAAMNAPRTMKKGGCTKMARGGGIEIRGKTKGRFV
jgi:hypothetical protein